MKVIKRDDSVQQFNFSKIEYAVDKAFKSTTDIFNTFVKYNSDRKYYSDTLKSEPGFYYDEISPIIADLDNKLDDIKIKIEEFNAETRKFTEYLKTVFEKINKEQITVEEIQDIIQKELIKKNKYNVVENFILYRQKHAEIRQNKSKLIKDVNKALNASDIQNQNANVDEASFGGRIGEAARVVCKDAALKLMSKMARKNHEEGWIYIHDLDSYAAGMHNCLSIPFDELLENGFITRQTDVRGANSVNTALQLVAVIFQLQSLQQFGGVSATHLDWTLQPYVRKSFFKHYNDIRDTLSLKPISIDDKFITTTDMKDPVYRGKHWWNLVQRYVYNKAIKRVRKEVHQGVEGLYHNLNTLQSRSGNQLPFTSINYGTCTSQAGQMITEELLKVSIEGLGKHKLTSIFPCGIFQYMKGVNDKPGTPNYYLKRLALESDVHRIYPNWANVDWSGNVGYDRNDPKTYFSTMGCRTANGWDINGLGQQKDGRGNICPVTIILPKIAIEIVNGEKDPQTYDERIEKFMELLDTKIHEAKDMLLERFEHICSQSPDSAKFMWDNNTMAGYVPEESIRSALKHGTLAIGQIALAETLQILIHTDHTTENGMALAKRIEGLFKQRCAEFKEEYKLNFGVYYTPAENLCHTAFKKWKSKYGDIENVTYYYDKEGERIDKEFFTNSIHVPVYNDMDAFQKIDIESQLTGFSSAGCITYVEVPSTAIHNIDAIEKLVDYAMEHDIPYFALNFPLDYCPKCHATGDFNGVCPVCGNTEIDELRRVTGYLSTTKKHFNKGKQQEEDLREQHFKN